MNALPPEERPLPAAKSELVSFDSVCKTFPARGTRGSRVHALSDVSFTLRAGETLAVVGESGSGKSTLARVAMQLTKPDTGVVSFEGTDVSRMKRAEITRMRRRMQMVFQDPYSSLNSRITVGESIEEPAVIHRVGTKNSRRTRAGELLELVGLRGADLVKYPHQFSGGQRQRVCIARALMLEPEIVILDEPVSALDVSTQAQVVNLLTRLQAELGLAYLFVSHDLSVVRHMADRLMVLYLGRIAEMGASEDIFHDSSHPYTASLLSAVPSETPRDREHRTRIVLVGDPPDPSNPPSGCSFHTRCWRATARCAVERPPVAGIAGSAREVACHYPLNADSSVSPRLTSSPGEPLDNESKETMKELP